MHFFTLAGNITYDRVFLGGWGQRGPGFGKGIGTRIGKREDACICIRRFLRPLPCCLFVCFCGEEGGGDGWFREVAFRVLRLPLSPFFRLRIVGVGLYPRMCLVFASSCCLPTYLLVYIYIHIPPSTPNTAGLSLFLPFLVLLSWFFCFCLFLFFFPFFIKKKQKVILNRQSSPRKMSGLLAVYLATKRCNSNEQLSVFPGDRVLRSRKDLARGGHQRSGTVSFSNSA